MNRVKLYTTEPCGFCRPAQALLHKRTGQYTESNLAKDAAGRGPLVRETGMMTFPQVVIDGRTIGGYDALVRVDRKGELAGLAQAA